MSPELKEKDRHVLFVIPYFGEHYPAKRLVCILVFHRPMLSGQYDIGLYTSPHIVAVRERIRINGSPISEEDFAKYFFEVWDMLDRNDEACGLLVTLFL